MKKHLFPESALPANRPVPLEREGSGDHPDGAPGYGNDPLKLLEIQRNFAVNLLFARDLRECLDLLLTSALSLEGFDCGGIYLCDETTGGLDLSLIHI